MTRWMGGDTVQRETWSHDWGINPPFKRALINTQNALEVGNIAKNTISQYLKPFSQYAIFIMVYGANKNCIQCFIHCTALNPVKQD